MILEYVRAVRDKEAQVVKIEMFIDGIESDVEMALDNALELRNALDEIFHMPVTPDGLYYPSTGQLYVVFPPGDIATVVSTE